MTVVEPLKQLRQTLETAPSNPHGSIEPSIRTTNYKKYAGLILNYYKWNVLVRPQYGTWLTPNA